MSEPSNALKWKRWIDTLLMWWQDPKQLEDDGVVPPSREEIRLAIDYTQKLAESEAPTAVSPDGDGGITFHWRGTDGSSRLEFLKSGHVDFYRFVDGQLAESNRFQ